MPLSGHFMDIGGRVLVYQTEKRKKFASEARLSLLFPLAIQSRFVSMPLSGHFMDIGDRY